MLLIKNMLCSKPHYQIVFQLKALLFKILTIFARGRGRASRGIAPRVAPLAALLPICAHDCLLCVQKTVLCLHTTVVCLHNTVSCLHKTVLCVYDPSSLGLKEANGTDRYLLAGAGALLAASLRLLRCHQVCAHDRLVCAHDCLVYAQHSRMPAQDSLVCAHHSLLGAHDCLVSAYDCLVCAHESLMRGQIPARGCGRASRGIAPRAAPLAALPPSPPAGEKML